MKHSKKTLSLLVVLTLALTAGCSGNGDSAEKSASSAAGTVEVRPVESSSSDDKTPAYSISAASVPGASSEDSKAKQESPASEQASGNASESKDAEGEKKPGEEETKEVAGFLTVEEAQKLFLADYPDYAITEIGYEEGDPAWYTFYGFKDGKEIEVSVSATTGETFLEEEEEESSSDKALDLGSYLSPDKALEKATEYAEEDTIWEWSLSYEDGKPVYLYDCETYHGIEYQIRIDAVDGTLTEIVD